MSSDILADPLSIYLEEASRCAFINPCGFGLWGSLSRNELTPFSDVDVICKPLSNKTITGSCFAQLSAWWPVDLTIIHDDVLQFALTNGTKFHSIFFATNLIGDAAALADILGAQKKLHCDSLLRAREILNIIGSQHRIALTLSPNDRRIAKCGPTGTTVITRLIQAAQLRWPELVGEQPRFILSMLSSRYGIDSQSVIDSWTSCFVWRRQVEQLWPAIPSQLLQFSLSSNVLCLRRHLIAELMNWIQVQAGVEAHLLEQFCAMLDIGCHIVAPHSISEQINHWLIAFNETKPKILHDIMLTQGRDWWIASTLAANPQSPATILDMLAFPSWDVSIQDWQTVRLYVAGNPNTATKTLIKLINTPGYRSQDYEAAKANLNWRTR